MTWLQTFHRLSDALTFALYGLAVATVLTGAVYALVLGVAYAWRRRRQAALTRVVQRELDRRRLTETEAEFILAAAPKVAEGEVA